MLQGVKVYDYVCQHQQPSYTPKIYKTLVIPYYSQFIQSVSNDHMTVK